VSAPIIDANRSHSFTEYKITGAFDSVCNAIATLFSEYDPRAYGTKVRSIEMNTDGSYIAQMWRSNSAD